MKYYWSFLYLLLAALCLLMALLALENGDSFIILTKTEQIFMKIFGFSGFLLFILLFLASEARNLNSSILELIEEIKKMKEQQGDGENNTPKSCQ